MWNGISFITPVWSLYVCARARVHVCVFMPETNGSSLGFTNQLAYAYWWAPHPKEIPYLETKEINNKKWTAVLRTVIRDWLLTYIHLPFWWPTISKTKTSQPNNEFPRNGVMANSIESTVTLLETVQLPKGPWVSKAGKQGGKSQENITPKNKHF